MDDAFIDGINTKCVLFLCLLFSELQFASVRPSVIAAACVATAVRGIFQQTQLSQSIASALASFAAQLQIDINSVSHSIDVFFGALPNLFAISFLSLSFVGYRCVRESN